MTFEPDTTKNIRSQDRIGMSGLINLGLQFINKIHSSRLSYIWVRL